MENEGQEQQAFLHFMAHKVTHHLVQIVHPANFTANE